MGAQYLVTVRYCGRDFTDAELELIASAIREYPTREAIARAACARLNWVKPDGLPKTMSAKVALLRMHRDGLIVLPAPEHEGHNVRRPLAATPASDPGEPLDCSRGDIQDLCLRRIQTRADSRLWNEFVGRYHYLGYVPLTGAQIRYFIEGNGHILGALGIGASAWKIAPRDLFIGWSHEQRRARLHLVVNNSRFLILPWIHVKYLASSVLSMLCRRLANDWQEIYGYHPVLLETFVEQDRFRGTCYLAANWIHVGCTQGRGKLDVHTLRQKPVKEIFLFPLIKNFRIILTDGITE
jgi:hypothetical protein